MSLQTFVVFSDPAKSTMLSRETFTAPISLSACTAHNSTAQHSAALQRTATATHPNAHVHCNPSHSDSMDSAPLAAAARTPNAYLPTALS